MRHVSIIKTHETFHTFPCPLQATGWMWMLMPWWDPRVKEGRADPLLTVECGTIWILCDEKCFYHVRPLKPWVCTSEWLVSPSLKLS